MSRIVLRKAGLILTSTDDESVEALSRYKDGTEVWAEIVRATARNMLQHRLFFALAGIVAESMDVSVDVVRKDALIRLGYTDTWIDAESNLHIEAKSMRVVGGMTEHEFQDFFHRAVNLMAGWIGADHKDLMRRFNELAADKRYEGVRHG
jgi:head-tail adaptor